MARYRLLNKTSSATKQNRSKRGVILTWFSSWFSAQGGFREEEKMMMTEVANHSKRSHTDSYFNSSSSSTRAIISSSEEDFGNMTSKKPRTTSPRSISISPKEKKDKISERVAALQQLVSPFGKTDTASVLQEASAYIKFLHQQLQVLSSPYLRAPVAADMPEDSEYYSLRRRGLCLMPVKLTLQIAQSNGADLWAPANSSARR